MYECVSCEEGVCGDHSDFCIVCDEAVCNNCHMTCNSCGGIFHDSCGSPTDGKGDMCDSCQDDADDSDSNVLSENDTTEITPVREIASDNE